MLVSNYFSELNTVVAVLYFLTMLIIAALSSKLELCALFVSIAALGRHLKMQKTMFFVLLLMLPFGVIVTLINSLSFSDKSNFLTQFTLPLLDIVIKLSLVNLVTGLVELVRVITLTYIFLVFSRCITQIRVLNLVKGMSFQVGLTLILAIRLIPTFKNEFELQSINIGNNKKRWDGLQGLLERVIERSSSLAATLEIRGYGVSRSSSLSKLSWNISDYLTLTTLGIALVVTAATRVGFDSFWVHANLCMGAVFLLQIPGLIYIFYFCKRSSFAYL